MSGEDGMDLERRDERIEALAPDLCTEFGHRCRQRLWKKLRTRVALAHHACAAMLLGEVCQMEVAGEGARHTLSAIERPRGDSLLGLALAVRVLPSAAHQVAT